jgi:hypothetical protein
MSATDSRRDDLPMRTAVGTGAWTICTGTLTCVASTTTSAILRCVCVPVQYN